MVKENRTAEENTEAFSNIKKVNSLVQKSGQGSFAALVSDYKSVQKKIDAALDKIRNRVAERERLRKEEAEKAKQAELEKKAKPAPPPAPKEEPVKEVSVPQEKTSVPQEAEKPVEAVKPAPITKPEKVAVKEESPAAQEKSEKKESVRTMTFEQNAAPQVKSTPSFVRGMYTPPPILQKPSQPKGQMGSRSGQPRGNGPRQQGQGAFQQKSGSGFMQGSKPAAGGASRPAPRSGAPKMVAMPVAPVKDRKAFDKKKDFNKPEDKKTMNKRTLIRKGFITDDVGEERMGTRKLKNKKPKAPVVVAPVKIEKAVITTENLTVKILSEKIGKTAQEIIKQLMLLGIMTNINSVVDFPTMELVANELGVELELKLEQTKEEKLEAMHEEQDDEKDLVKRPPVITVMGHVDHGKTSLLDAIRKTSVAAGEAGGITQHIGAYSVMCKGEKITFLDTPGHEAFTEMRARGTFVTDIAVLIVAADDGVMPQTIESINHAKAAKVPVIVAINKIDKPGANIERVKQALTEYDLVPEEWGGETIMVPVSAKTGEGIDKLLEMILFLAEYNNYRANPKRQARGSVVESKLDKGKGPVANIIVQNGTLHVGDYVVSGLTSGRVRGMVDDKGRSVKEAGPSSPVSILGFTDVPNAGDPIYVVDDEKTAKQVIAERTAKLKNEQANQGQKITLDDVFNKISEGKMKELNLLIKADVQGSVEALKTSLEKLSNDEVKVNVVHGGVGAINKSDLMLAGVSNAIIIGFNVRPDSESKALAESTGVDIRIYNIIYEAIDDIEAAMKGLIAPKYKESVLGRAQIRSVIKISGVGAIAGCYVLSGKLARNAKVRVYRNDVVIFDGSVNNLKRFKDDVKEVAAGYECGLSFDNFEAFNENDEVEAYVLEQEK